MKTRDVVQSCETSRRLKKWGLEEFGSLVSFSRALGISQQSLHDYTSGRTLPGNKTQSRLRALGCDIEWLMTGAPTGSAVQRSMRKRPRSVGWAKFEGRVVTRRDGKEVLVNKSVADGAGVPYRRGRFFCLEIAGDGLLTAAPLQVYPGDICIFESERLPRNGDIVAARLKRSRVIVRVASHVTAHELELSTANTFRNYPVIRVKRSDIEHLGVLKSILQLTREEKKFFGIE
jgi:hypothetical protein